MIPPGARYAVYVTLVSDPDLQAVIGKMTAAGGEPGPDDFSWADAALGASRFLLACRRCDKPGVLTFGSAAGRGGWASRHTRETGHDSWLVRDGGEIVITFLAECPDCRDYLALTAAAGVLDERGLRGGEAVSIWLRETAKAMVRTLTGTLGTIADELAGMKPPRFDGAADRDRWAETHASLTGHVVERAADIR